MMLLLLLSLTTKSADNQFQNKRTMKNLFNNIKLLLICTFTGITFLSCSKDFDPKEEEIQNKTNTNLFSSNYAEYVKMNVSIPALEIKRSFVYLPGDDDWNYSHHPSMAFFKGKFYAVFSNGIRGEDEGGQRVLFSTSIDGINWEECRVVKDTDFEHVLTPGGILANEDLLVVYYTRNDYVGGTARPNTRLFAMHSKDGENWEGPVDLGLQTFPSHSPTKLSSGRLLITGNRHFFYTDNPTGLSGWKRSGFSEFKPGDEAILVEGSIIELEDSVYALFRDNIGKKHLWQESSLNGEKWGSPTKTKFTNDDTKIHFGKFPDGRSYYVGTPDTTRMGQRIPLVLSISEDNFKFEEHYIIANDIYQIRYQEGRWKTGQFGYPESIVHDGYLYVIASRRKEAIEVIRIALSQLSK